VAAKREIDFYKRIGKNIKAVREKQGVSQVELAAMCDLEKGRMSNIERGANITVKTLLKIADALEVSPAVLVG
jgi:transcriptional regulator with XRE-family HTH domain